ncbi:MAG: TerB family tellurite resistance protein [Rhizobiaceae bacterium]
MIERLISFLRDMSVSSDIRDADGADDPRIATAALMVHVMDADGERRSGEREALLTALAETLDVSGNELQAIIAAGEKADREAIDLYSFTSVLNRHLDDAAKKNFVAAMWEVVYADGELHELEDNVVWRVAELIGVDARDRVVLRLEARHAAGVGGGVED